MFAWREEILPGVTAAFTNTDAGNLALHVGDDPAAVAARRAQLEETLGVAPAGLKFMSQVHGSAVVLMTADSPAPEADAMVSHGVPLAVMVADCIPVLLAGVGPTGPVLAAVHAGRPGVANGIVLAAVWAMRAAGAENIRAWLGPSICGHCYEVPEALRAEVSAVVPATYGVTSWGTPSLDLPAGAISQLAAVGVSIEFTGACTLETESLFSYRRDQRTGRFAGVLVTHD